MKTNEILNRYVARKKENYGVSLRTLSTQLDVSPSFLSRILSGKKPVPYALLLKMQKVFDIEPEVFEGIREAHTDHIPDTNQSLAAKGQRSVTTELQEWELSKPDSYKILRNWYYIAILEYVSLKKFDRSSESIANHFELSIEATEVALRELGALELIVKTEDGKWKKSQKKLRWSSAIPTSEIGNFHKIMMDKAKEQLLLKNQRAFERRLITGVTFTIPSKKVNLAKKRLNEFIHELVNELMDEDSADTEVYHLASQLFPLSK